MLDLSLDSDTPLLAMIPNGRQKGSISVLKRSAKNQSPWSVIILGTGASDLEEKTDHLKESTLIECVRDKVQQSIITSNYAGADILLMPSDMSHVVYSQMMPCVTVAFQLLRQSVA
jgi:glycogen synthase